MPLICTRGSWPHLIDVSVVIHTVWVKKIPPPAVFWNIFPNGWEFLINFYTPIIRSYLRRITNFYSILSPTLWRSYAIISETTHWILYISPELNFLVCLLSKWRHCWRHVICSMFVDIIKAADLGWLASDDDQQGGTAAAVPPPFRPSEPALCRSCPLVTPY